MNARAPSWFHRAAHTPMRDWIRGRVTAGLDWRNSIRSSTLTPEAAQRVETVVRRTRLWRSEKCEVAQELITHFLDGVEAGRPVEDLIQTFGDPGQVARLIRRARRRNRPFLWQALRRVTQGLAVLLLLYAGLFLIALTRHPNPSVDYVALFNRDAQALPESDRAWPLYRSLMEQYPDFPRGLGSVDFGFLETDAVGGKRPCRPGDPGWPKVREYLASHPSILDGLRTAALKPGLGFVTGHSWQLDERDAALLIGTNFVVGSPPSPDRRIQEEWLAGVLLPHLAPMKGWARILCADLLAAGEDGDGSRVVTNHRALMGLARQARETPFLINQLVAVSIVSMANTCLAEVLATRSSILSRDQMVALAHGLADARYTVETDLGAERLFFHDTAQRIFTDNGKGDGVITADGLRLLGLMQDDPFGEEGSLENRVALAAATPVATGLIASRRVMTAKYESLISQMESDARRPLWEQLAEPSPAVAELDRLGASPLLKTRFLPILMLMPSLGSAARRGLECGVFNDALTVAIGLELYHREFGRYPDSLETLAPRWMPVVPLDSSSGKPLLFKLTGSGPLIYGRGVDGDDDGGLMSEEAIRTWPKLVLKEDSTDWVLFPPPERPPKAESDLPEAGTIDPGMPQ